MFLHFRETKRYFTALSQGNVIQRKLQGKKMRGVQILQEKR